MTDNTCPCGSTLAFTDCCEPLIKGARLAPTAESLMRSRYTAYTLQDDEYLLSSWHSDTRPSENPSDDDQTRWTGLKIIRTQEGGENDNEGIVEFIATCTVKGVPSQLHEISHFSRQDGRWVYVEGEGQQPLRREQAKVGRNDPCPCGSGKKFKKCCGA